MLDLALTDRSTSYPSVDMRLQIFCFLSSCCPRLLPPSRSNIFSGPYSLVTSPRNPGFQQLSIYPHFLQNFLMCHVCVVMGIHDILLYSELIFVLLILALSCNGLTKVSFFLKSNTESTPVLCCISLLSSLGVIKNSNMAYSLVSLVINWVVVSICRPVVL